MKRTVSTISALFILAIALHAQVPDNDNFIVTHGPWLQNLTSTGVTVMWTTNKPAIPGITLNDPGGNTRFIRNSTDGIVDGGGMLQRIRVEGLEPGVTYSYAINSVQVLKYQAYRIYYGDTLSGKPLTFSTLNPEIENIGFTVYNDIHENSWKLGSYYRNGDSSARDLFFLNGDMIDFLQSPDQLFPGFIDTAVFYFARQKPFVYVRGNHETRGYAARDLKDYFDFTENRFYSAFDYGPFHFLILDCGEDKPDNNRYYYGLADYDSYRFQQLEWLKQHIRSESYRKAKYRIVIIHMPVIKQEKQAHGMKFLADNFGPVLRDAGIDLMISGHTHRTAIYDKAGSGLNYPVVVSSNNSFVEVKAGMKGLNAVVKDLDGKVVAGHNVN